MLSSHQSPALKDTNIKITLVGDSGVGKSNIRERLNGRPFQNFSEPTVGAAFSTQTIYVDERRVCREVWDTAGEERYHAILPLYYRSADIALITLSSKQSTQWFDSWKKQIHNWKSQIRSNTDKPSLAVTVNEFNEDQLQETEKAALLVDKEKLKTHCEEMKLDLYFVNAKTGAGVKELFHEATKKHLAIPNIAPEKTAPAPSNTTAAKTAEEKPDPRFDFSKYRQVTFSLFGTKFSLNLKSRLTGTHHKDRLAAVSSALNAYKNYADGTQRMIKLLENQIALLSNEKRTDTHDHIDARWTTKISNVPTTLLKSGAYKIFKDLKDQLEQEIRAKNTSQMAAKP